MLTPAHLHAFIIQRYVYYSGVIVIYLWREGMKPAWWCTQNLYFGDNMGKCSTACMPWYLKHHPSLSKHFVIAFGDFDGATDLCT